MDTKRVLLVEDQHAFLLRELLELHGDDFSYDIANDGVEALERLVTGPRPDLVLLDLRLPGVDGLQVLDAFHKSDSCLPVIVVSAYGDKRTRQEAARRGAIGFYQKPVDPARLYKAMRATVAVMASQGCDTPVPEGRQAQLLASQRRLNKLKERQALLGLSAPPELLIEIEDLEQKLQGFGKQEQKS